MEKIIARLTQNSTWRGVILLVGAISIAVQPERATEITAASLGLVGALNVVRNS